MRRNVSILFLLLSLAACAAPNVAARLAPRAAEAIDPRVPVVNAVAATPVEPALAARLAALIDQARAGDVAFRAALAIADGRTSAAGAAESESWVSAQQAISAAIAARGPTTRALGDINALAANRIAPDSTIGRGDFDAIQAALAEVGDLDRRQAEAIEALEARLRR